MTPTDLAAFQLRSKQMTRTNLAYFDGSYGYLTIIDDDGNFHEITTCKAHPNHYIRIDGRHDWQLCVGGSWRGETLSWAPKANEMAKWFAHDCTARLFKTRAGYDRARARQAAWMAP